MKYHFLTGSYAEREQPGVCRVAFDPEVGFTLETAGTGYANPSFVLPRAYRLNRVTLCLEDTGMALEIGCPVCLCPLETQ